MRWRKWVKWCAIGVGAFVVLVLFLVIAAPAPLLPFETPGATRLRYVRVSDGVCTTSWMIKRSQGIVDEAAGKGLTNWSRSQEQGGLSSIVYARAEATVTIVGWNFGTDSEPDTHVLYDRPATFIDHVDAAISRARSWL